jgi:hypothetical protein
MEEALSPLASWEGFYVIVGPSAAVLIGLQFVVITMSAELSTGNTAAIRAFGTPTIVHFCAVLFIAAVLTAPWPALAAAAIVLGACGVAGLVYAAIVVQQARLQTDYVPVLEDWIWHGALPLVAYTTLIVAAFILQTDPTTILFVIGGIALLLLFIGIHNAWDAVVYIVFRRRQSGQAEAPPVAAVATGEDDEA